MTNFEELYNLELAKNAKLTRTMLDAIPELREWDLEDISSIADRFVAVRSENLSLSDQLAQLVSTECAHLKKEIERLGQQVRQAGDALAEANRRREYAARNAHDWVSDVIAFHEKFGQAITRDGVDVCPNDDLVSLRLSLIQEEYTEFLQALFVSHEIHVADALADLIYVLIGTAITFGMDLRPVWVEVHRSNMEKVGGQIRADGKILKPSGWVGPDIGGALKRGAL